MNDAPDRLLAWLFRRAPPEEPPVRTGLYAILDSARDRRMFRAISETGLPHHCLFSGRLDPALQAVAPYLVELRPEASFVRRLLGDGWGRAWGIYVASPASLEELRRHFRRFLRVEDERGRRMLFRYYDPRVLRVYLPTCNEEELATVFGPVTRYVLEAEDPDRLLELSLHGGALVTRAILWRSERPDDVGSPLTSSSS